MRRSAEDLLTIHLADCEYMTERLRTVVEGIPASP